MGEFRSKNVNLIIFFFIVSHFLLLSHTLNFSTTSPLAFRCLPYQSSILLQLKQELMHKSPPLYDVDDNASYQKMETWRAGTDCCFWEGVMCDVATGHVVSLDLSNSRLQGPLSHNSSLFRLLQLQQLNLAFNNFSLSLIPTGFGQLSRLTHLNLSSSMFSGNIPLQFSSLSKLVSLDLSKNYDHTSSLMIVDLKELVQNMTFLRELHLDMVDLSLTQLQSLENLTLLTSLSLRRCSLQGNFPNKIFLLPEIQAVDLSFNENLAGSLPFHFDSKLVLLNLSWGNFSGKLPDSIGKLNSLRILDLSSCSFSGKIPSSLGNLSQLIHLDLSFNNFKGQLPFTLGNLKMLSVIDFTRAQITGEIPSSLGNLTQLKELALSDNCLSGQIPASLGHQKQLLILDLSSNRFDGAIPLSLSMLPSLNSLMLDNNMLTGSFDIHMNISSSQLKYLSLSRNMLSGQIPKLISKLESLRLLDLHSNNLSGIVELGNLTKLSFLDLSDNSFSVTKASTNSTYPKLIVIFLSSCNILEFPDFLKDQVHNVELLDLSNNKIEGKIPKWLYEVGIETLSLLNLSHNFISSWEQAPVILPWKVLKYLNLQSNSLQGLVVIPSLSTRYFFISKNNLTGRIPRLFCKLSYLQVLDVSNNHFTGKIPRCLSNFSNFLSVLNLRRNNFQGKIPENFVDGCNLSRLDLSHNNLHGNIPRCLAKCRKLEVLNLGHNQINDTFPFFLKKSQELRVLVLRSNKFFGPIWDPHKYLSFAKLRIIDLSFNNFSGPLPSGYFQSWTSMVEVNNSGLRYMVDRSGYYHDSVTVDKGSSEMDLVMVSNLWTAIDISNNRFEGELPNSMANLQALIVLNLSSNSFTGPIPSSFGNLTQLESLDLSNNKISGEIPPQFTRLTFLEYLNLSQNNLMGPIPQGGQIGTFPSSSFEGNSGLCGFPISRMCANEESPTSSNILETKSESRFDITWQQVLIGYACGAAIGVVIGCRFLWFPTIIDNVGAWKERQGRSKVTRKDLGYGSHRDEDGTYYVTS
ncbi:Leucine-rich repeat domain containing protein [Trema orientale]|uniref:Leucine-rich repeat domain containing protein n=1 Tax=Trema orientale TaxID=63057 RepID=A0A2P5ES58_TREOI|nr:Leucine-rich repeat domain containing protein [Trema orientale]